MPDGSVKLTEEQQNAKQYPRRFYARHMQPGVCKYNSETVLVDTDAIKSMIGSDAIGKPVYIRHNSAPNDERLKNLKQEAAGYIIDSFYNELDGWAWFEFLAIDDECHNAISKGWAISNAYIPTHWGPGGTKNNVPYDRQILNGNFTHLAIVPDPRYEDAVIMSPEKYAAYQKSKKRQLEELQNSKTEPSGGKMFKLFKTKREEVSAIDSDTQIELEGGKVVTVAEMINSLKASDDAAAAKAKADKEAADKAALEKTNSSEKINGESVVECEGVTMPLKDLVNKYNSAMRKNEMDEDEKKKLKEKEEKENAEAAEKEKEKANSSGKTVVQAANEHFLELQNAAGIKRDAPKVLETSINRVARGKARYGKQN